MNSSIYDSHNELLHVGQDLLHRLFDHKFFLNGELRYFVKEFEEKRNDKEESLIKDIEDNLAKISETKVSSEVTEANENSIKNLNLKMDHLLNLCKELQESEEINIINRNKKFEEYSKELKKIREHEIELSKEEEKREELIFESKVKDLISYYEHLESQLNLNCDKQE